MSSWSNFTLHLMSVCLTMSVYLKAWQSNHLEMESVTPGDYMRKKGIHSINNLCKNVYLLERRSKEWIAWSEQFSCIWSTWRGFNSNIPRSYVTRTCLNKSYLPSCRTSNCSHHYLKLSLYLSICTQVLVTGLQINNYSTPPSNLYFKSFKNKYLHQKTHKIYYWSNS